MSYNNRKKDPLRVLGRSKGYSKKELYNYLPRHSEFTPKLFKEIKKLPDFVLRNIGTPLARKINKMVKEVSLEAYRAKQFTRTQINNRGVLYGIVLLKHRVIDIVLNYFHQRWPQCVICLYNEHIQKTAIINENGTIHEIELPLEQVVENVSKNRPIIHYFEDIQISGEEIFETLYKSQNVKNRENKRYFKAMIPNYCYKLPGMRKGIERKFSSKNKTLNDFID